MNKITVMNEKEDGRAEQAVVLDATDGYCYYGLRRGSRNGEQP